MSWKLEANRMWPRIRSTPATPTSILLIRLVVVDEDEEEQDKVIVGKRKMLCQNIIGQKRLMSNYGNTNLVTFSY